MTGQNNDNKYSQIRAVILDYGQVLCLRPDPEVLLALADFFGIEPGKFFERYVASRGPYDQGVVNAEQYWRDFARSFDVEIDATAILQLRGWDTEMWSSVDPEMMNWIEMLYRARITTALLSNMQIDMASHAREHFAWLAYFHHQIFSCDVGMIKPDPAIYHECLQRIGVQPHEALFIDDRWDNVRAAAANGINALRFESVQQLRSELQALGFPILPGSSEL